MRYNVKSRLDKLGIRPERSLGQNFLEDTDIAKKIVRAGHISSDETVLEIGPGLGVLTDELLKDAGDVILIEKETALVGYLEGRYEDHDCRVIEGDVLDLELPYFDKVVSNLPFSISSPITFRLLKKDLELGVLTYQKEYADRMTAEVGSEDYSRLTVMVSTYADVQRLFDISRQEFFPPPKVDCSVIRLIPKEPGFEIKDRELFSEVTKVLFNYRRKMIKNGLSEGFELKRSDLEDIPHSKRRVGNISPEQISEIAGRLMDEGLLDR